MKQNEYKYTLDMLRPGDAVRLTGSIAAGGMRRRLRDVGFCDGEKVVCVMKSPLGDPSAFLVRGTLIALRREDARLITVAK